MTTQFHQIEWDDRLARDWASLLTLAIAEDLGASGDWTSKALIPEMAAGRAEVVARRPGVVAGLAAMPQTAAAFHPGLKWNPAVEDGATVAPGNAVGSIEGPLRGILATERVLLNLLGRLSGIATLTRRCVEAVAGTNARIYDTRKTTPGWRRLEKYAVRRGGGWNHRGGLDEAVLIKDNHLAIVGQVANLSHTNSDATGLVGQVANLSHTNSDATGLVGQVANLSYDSAEAVRRARDFVRRHAIEAEMPIEIELDSLDRFDDVLNARPDIVLLDNMTPSQLREAVARRNAVAPAVELEASGGISLDTIRAVAESGVERISIGALTHSAVSLDFGLDWRSVYGYSE